MRSKGESRSFPKMFLNFFESENFKKLFQKKNSRNLFLEIFEFFFSKIFLKIFQKKFSRKFKPIFFFEKFSKKNFQKFPKKNFFEIFFWNFYFQKNFKISSESYESHLSNARNHNYYEQKLTNISTVKKFWDNILCAFKDFEIYWVTPVPLGRFESALLSVIFENFWCFCSNFISPQKFPKQCHRQFTDHTTHSKFPKTIKTNWFEQCSIT